MPTAGEAADVTDVADQAGGAGRADAVEVLQSAAAGLDRSVSSVFAVLIFLSIWTILATPSTIASFRLS